MNEDFTFCAEEDLVEVAELVEEVVVDLSILPAPLVFTSIIGWKKKQLASPSHHHCNK